MKKLYQNWTIGGSGYAVLQDKLIVENRRFNKPDDEIVEDVKLYEDWYKLTYKVDDASKPVTLFNEYDENIYEGLYLTDIEGLAILEGGQKGKKPTVVEPSFTHTFSTTGEHVVYAKLSRNREAFMYVSKLIEAIIPDGVTEIGNHAFFGCNNLTNVIIPNSCTYIANEVFFNCTSLIKIIIPESVRSIGYYTFSGCKSISEITFPESIGYIDTYALTVMPNLHKITSLAMTAPKIIDDYGYGDMGRPSDYGTLYVPAGAIGYDKWMEVLGEGWTILYLNELID